MKPSPTSTPSRVATQAAPSTSLTFKRVALGVTFTDAQVSSVTKGQRFRKASEKAAVKLLDDPLRAGRGQTHARIPFARSHSVAI